MVLSSVSTFQNTVTKINAEADLGYYWACLSSRKILGDNNSRIRSKVEFTDNFISNTRDTYKLELDNKKIIVGEGARQHNFELDKTRDEAYRILIYTLLSTLAKDSNPLDINLVTNYPLSVYNNDSKTTFEQFLKTKEYVSVLLNGKPKLFNISNCLVYPQCIPAAYVNQSYFKNQTTALVDMGGITCQGVILKNFNITPDSKWCENLGGLILLNNIREALNTKFSINIQDYEMDNILENGLPQDRQKSNIIIKDIIHMHISKIKNQMKLKSWNIDNLNIVFTGGGSLLIKSILLNSFNYCKLSNNPLWDGTLGLRAVSDNVY